MPDGSERPVSSESRSLRPAKQNYAQVEKEDLSLVLESKVSPVFVNQKLTMVTDHKALTTFESNVGNSYFSSCQIAETDSLLSA